ncbi:MAG: hypothetical protein ACKOZU_10430 [Planctomycetaceae bacterium]
MPTSLPACATHLARAGIRHHLDATDAAIRLVFVTRHYENPRGEKLAIVRLETSDGGNRLRASIARAFPVTDDPAAACLALCRLAADTPLVGVEYDAHGEGLRLVAEAAVEDGRLTQRQLLALVDGLVEAAEAWHVGLRDEARRGRRVRRAA